MSDLRIALTEFWKDTIKGKSPSTTGSSTASELSLSAFTGKCYRCGEEGHRAYTCTAEVADGASVSRGQFHSKCNLCGRVGHKAVNCWEREDNRDRRPPGFVPVSERATADATRSGREQGLVSVDKGRVMESEVLLYGQGLTFPRKPQLLNDPNLWIADSGASVHSTPFCHGLTNLKTPGDGAGITMGNGETEMVTAIGDIRGAWCNKHGVETCRVNLTDVTVLPGGKYNLFSLGTMMKKGWQMSGDDQGITISKGGVQLAFDIIIPTPKGILYAMYLKRGGTGTAEVAGVGTEQVSMSYRKAHEVLGHMSSELVRKTAHVLGWRLTTKIEAVCEACTVGKAKQKNVPKSSTHQVAGNAGERIFLDVSTVKQPAVLGGGEAVGEDRKLNKSNWRIMVDEKTQLKFSNFFETKSGMVEPTCEQFSKWIKDGFPLRYVRLDDGGENIKLQSRCQSESWKLNLVFEFTGRDTPQRNHLAELGFAIIANRGRALMAHANVPKEIRYRVWREAFQTATLLDGLVPVVLDGVQETRYVHWCGGNPEFSRFLRVWGEAGTVKLRTSMTPKIEDRGMQCMMVGYALNHPGDTYRMWDPSTGRVHVTRDIIWLRRMFFPRPEYLPDVIVTPVIEDLPMVTTVPRVIEIPVQPDVEAGEGIGEHPSPAESEEDDGEDVIAVGDVGSDVGSDPVSEGQGHQGVQLDPDLDVGDRVDEEVQDGNQDTGWTEVSTLRRSHRVSRRPVRLIEEISNVAVGTGYYDLLDDYDSIEIDDEYGMVGAGIGGGFDTTDELHTLKFKQAMQSENKAQWMEAVEEEHKKMTDYGVWVAVPVETLPRNSKILTSTWAMKKKANGVFRARLTARGYEQVDGLHYDETTKAAPVTNEMTIRIVFTLMMMAGWMSELVDVRGAFLNGRFSDEEVLYMHIPEGFGHLYPSGYVLRLLRTLYGLKQAAYAFWRELLHAMRSMNFSRSSADPCLYFRWRDDRLVIWLSWVDDLLVTGVRDDVRDAKQDLKGLFECDDIGPVQEYVGCKVEFDWAQGEAKFTQPVLIQSLRDEFGIVPDNDANTPATPGEVLCPGPPENYLSHLRMARYRSGVGKLLYLMKWTRPDIQNAVRELSRFMMRAVEAHDKAMRRVMRYCLNTADRGLILKPECRWDGGKDFKFRIHGVSDSDYAKDRETRRSVSGYSTFLNGCPISMKSKMQECVTLSSAEAELVSATQCVQDMLYVKKVLESMELQVDLPMILYLDNKGAKELMENWSVGGRTRHVDVRYFFLRELKEQNVLRLQWISTTENPSDIFTKNLGNPLFSKHVAVFCGRGECDHSPGEGVRGCNGKVECVRSVNGKDQCAVGTDIIMTESTTECTLKGINILQEKEVEVNGAQGICPLSPTII